MSKHRHSKDKLHLTYSEIRDEFASRKKKKVPFEKLPFYCCALSLAPFEDPVCTSDGHVFDLLYIMPFIRKYQRNPVTGAPLKASELIKMHWTRSENIHNPLEFQDPISYKIFTQFTHIVCIKTSGYVYAYDTVQELNKKPKLYQDLVTNEPFTLNDIITIQDPKKSKEVESFDYLINNLPFVPPQKLQPTITETETISRVFSQIDERKKAKKEEQQKEQQEKKKKKEELEAREDVKGFIQWCLETKVYKHDRETDMRSASITSTSFTPNQKAEMTFRQLKTSEIREKIYNWIKKHKSKGFIQLNTNFGKMTFLIHANLVPKTSENFLQLIQSKYYDGTKFHRLVKNFCLQGGDPTGTGSGGNSIFGSQFEDQFHESLTHDKLGVLSMANAGPGTNKSQFFITLTATEQLNNLHSVFGEIVEGENILKHINNEFSSSNHKPRQQILIEKAICYTNPFRQAIKNLKQQIEEEKKDKTAQQKQKQKERWLQQGNKFSLPFMSDKKGKKETLSDKLLQDYM